MIICAIANVLATLTSPIVVGYALYYLLTYGPFYGKVIVVATLSFSLYVAYYNRYHNPISIARRFREAKEEELRKKREREESAKKNSLRQRNRRIDEAEPRFDPELISNFPGYTPGQRILAFLKYHTIE